MLSLGYVQNYILEKNNKTNSEIKKYTRFCFDLFWTMNDEFNCTKPVMC